MGGEPIQNAWENMPQLRAWTELSGTVSEGLKKLGLNLVVLTIIYAFMKVLGMVNKQSANYFRYHEVAALL